MPATATPRKPQTLARKLVETRNTSRNRGLAAMLGLGESEKELARDFGSGLNDVIGRGTLASLIGLPGDLGGLAENGIRSALGMPQVQPYGGSEHIGQKLEEAGLVSPVRRPKTELLASLISPSQAASAAYRAPQMARAGVRVLDNLAAPRTMGNQTGAIENLWHGSPHTFDRFDLSKIGTGEGAQAYGHGAYLAESPDVAGEYQKRLSKDFLVDGAPIDADQSMRVMLDDIANGGRAEDWIRLTTKDMNEPDLVRASELAKTLVGKKVIEQSGVGGNLYQTRLAWPDPAREATDPLSPDHFLHWDKPLSEQAAKDKVVQAFKARGFDDWQIESMLNRGITGEQANVYLGGINGSETGAKSLLDAGVPGIRYLDAGSRGAGAGSHNYVVFDDSLIDIVSRNGQPVGNLGKMVAPQDEALRVAQQNAAKPPIIQTRKFKTDEGNFVVFDTEKMPTGRADMFTVHQSKDGYVVRNALVPDGMRGKGYASELYQRMNQESLAKTGKPLRSSQPRTLPTGEVVTELSPDGVALWESFVKKGLAEKLGEKSYRFIPSK